MIARDTDLHSSQTLEASVLEGCRHGEQAAWNALVDRYGRLVYSIPLRQGMSASCCDQVLLTVFRMLFDRLDVLADGDDLAGWLVRTTSRVCSERLARRHEAPPTSTVNENELLEDWRREESLRRAMTLLGERDQALLTACFCAEQGDGYAYLAELLGLRTQAFRRLTRVLHDIGFETQ